MAFSLGAQETSSSIVQDATYIRDRYFPDLGLGLEDGLLEINKRTRLKHQRLILELCRYRYCDAALREHLQRKARQAARVCSMPVYIFRELMLFLAEERAVAPGYSFLQDTVGQALTHEQERLMGLIRSRLTTHEIGALDALLADTTGLYEITQLKRQPRDFSRREIKREIERGEQIRPLYRLAQRLLPKLEISNESITYYASLVGYYSVYKLNRLDRSVTYLYLLCFLFHRYQRLHDNLITSFLHGVKGYSDQARAAAKEQIYREHLEGKQNLQRAAAVLKLFTDDRIAPETPFGRVRSRAFRILKRRQLEAVADQMAEQARVDETALQWEHLDTLVHQFKRQLRPVLLAVEFASVSRPDPLIEATQFLKTVFAKRKPLGQYPPEAFPLGFVPETVRRYLYVEQDPKQGFLADRYEFLVYRQLRHGLEAGNIFCRDSVRFRSFEDDLIDDERWQQQEQLIAETGLRLLSEPIEAHLSALEAQLEDRITEVNRRIAAGENEQIEVSRRGRNRRWKLARSPARASVNHPVFTVLEPVEISQVLHFVNRHSQFMDSFEHVRGRYVKGSSSEQALAACLVAWGTNKGLGRMGQISDIGYQRLATCSDNFIRLETLRAANDRVSNAIAALPGGGSEYV